MNVKQDAEKAWEFIEEAGVTLPCLLDTEGTYYAYYPVEEDDAPYPVDVVIDREGVIRYITNTYDAEALKDVIRQALEEPFSGAP